MVVGRGTNNSSLCKRIFVTKYSQTKPGPGLILWYGVIKSRRMRWAVRVARVGEARGVYRVLVGKPEGKGPLERHRCRWEDNIKMDLQEVGCGGMDWYGPAQDRDRWRALVNAVMNFGVP
jgi:hypothetical protein